jgi:hypothetical protein
MGGGAAKAYVHFECAQMKPLLHSRKAPKRNRGVGGVATRPHHGGWFILNSPGPQL